MAKQIDLKGKQVYIAGLKNSGKTNFCKWLLNTKFPMHMAFDPMDEYKDKWDFNQYIPESRRGSEAREELELFTDQLVKPSKASLDAVVVDECNRFHNKGGQLDGPIGEIVDVGSSHWNMATIFISRKPTQVHTDIRGLADYWFLFNLTDSNNIKMLNQDVADGLGDAVKALSPDSFECIVVPPDRENYFKMQSVPEQLNEKGEL
jgi:hypothetical protein